MKVSLLLVYFVCTLVLQSDCSPVRTLNGMYVFTNIIVVVVLVVVVVYCFFYWPWQKRIRIFVGVVIVVVVIVVVVIVIQFLGCHKWRLISLKLVHILKVKI